jgi:hypothetical protein
MHFRGTTMASLAQVAMLLFATALTSDSMEGNEPRDSGGSIANVQPAVASTVIASQSPGGMPAGGKPIERLREGTRLIDVVGTFQSLGNDSVSFSPGGKDSLRVLENLALQRVVFILDDNKGARQWIVSGIITEYKGSNYILVTKAQQQEGEAVAGP